jgi:cell division protein FtsQ
MGFVNTEQERSPGTALNVHVVAEPDLDFLNQLDVQDLIRSRGDSIIGQPRSSIDVAAIEKALNSHPDIKNAEVFLSIDGKLSVEVKQRRPLVRIINTDGESYYLDEEGKPMPLSDKFSARVLIANGNIFEPYSGRYMLSMQDLSKDSAMLANSVLDELYAMAAFISKDEFWRAQVQQVFINADKEIELVPTAGDQKILFGDTTDLEEKFEKLLTFYQQGLNATGWWNKYSQINLKFKNQVVCTRKETQNLN